MVKKTIALLLGGESSEREISLQSGENVYKNLDKNKYKIIKYDLKYDFKKFFSDCLDKKIDLVLPILHGQFGEDGKIQGFLEMIKIPYLFSDSSASNISINKNLSKIIVEKEGINIAKSLLLNKKEKISSPDIFKKIKLPIVVKPNKSGSSIGISIVDKEKDLLKATKEAFENDEEILLEEFIEGRELTVPVFGKEGRALPVIEIIPKISKWFDYQAKYNENGSEEVCPAKIPEKIKKEVQFLSEKIFLAIGAKDLARIDFIWNKKNKKLYFLEINTIPGLTKNSLTPKAIKAANFKMEEIFEKLIKQYI